MHAGPRASTGVLAVARTVRPPTCTTPTPGTAEVPAPIAPPPTVTTMKTPGKLGEPGAAAAAAGFPLPVHIRVLQAPLVMVVVVVLVAATLEMRGERSRGGMRSGRC